MAIKKIKENSLMQHADISFKMVQDMLHFDLGLSHELTSGIMNEYDKDSFNFKTLVSYWYEQIDALNKSESIENIELLNMEIRRFVHILYLK